LRQIEKVEREHKLDDVRSTVWVIRSLTQAVALIVVVAFLLDLKNGMFGSLFSVTEGYVDKATEWLVGFIHF
jgi:ATP-dependent phosphoenolpyruvate carboxykinase